jgi:hypothetical protein
MSASTRNQQNVHHQRHGRACPAEPPRHRKNSWQRELSRIKLAELRAHRSRLAFSQGDQAILDRQIRERAPDVRVLILSMHATSAHIFHALEAGVRGYTLKEAAGSNVVNAMRTVHSGRRFLSPNVMEIVAEPVGRPHRGDTAHFAIKRGYLPHPAWRCAPEPISCRTDASGEKRLARSPPDAFSAVLLRRVLFSGRCRNRELRPSPRGKLRRLSAGDFVGQRNCVA